MVNGSLVAYRWSGETDFVEDAFAHLVGPLGRRLQQRGTLYERIDSARS